MTMKDYLDCKVLLQAEHLPQPLSQQSRSCQHSSYIYRLCI